MKTDLLDWMIEKLKLTSDEEILDNELHDKNNLSFVSHTVIHKGRKTNRVYVKCVKDYIDCRAVIDEVKSGAVCVFILCPNETENACAMIQYLYGAVYSLDKSIEDVGKTVYMIN